MVPSYPRPFQVVFPGSIKHLKQEDTGYHLFLGINQMLVSRLVRIICSLRESLGRASVFCGPLIRQMDNSSSHLRSEGMHSALPDTEIGMEKVSPWKRDLLKDLARD